MIARMFTSDFFLDIPEELDLKPHYDDGSFRITITDLRNHHLRADFSKGDHVPPGPRKHAFDINYGDTDQVPDDAYFKVVFAIASGLDGKPRFISDRPNAPTGELKHPAATCGNKNALQVLRNFQRISDSEISFLIRKDRSLSKTNAAGFNLGIEFIDDQSGEPSQTVFDPKVPNDGN